MNFKTDIQPPACSKAALDSKKFVVNQARYIYDNQPIGSYVDFKFPEGSDIVTALRNVISKKVYDDWNTGGYIKQFKYRAEDNRQIMRIWRTA